MTTRFPIPLILLSLIIPYSVDAKAPTAQITITGPKLVTPLNTTDPAITAAHVWMGNFADWSSGPVTAPQDDSDPYQLHFWVRLNPDDIRLMYVLEYRWLEKEDRAVVCLPGRRSVWYSTNVSSILRTGKDGNCYYSEAKWGRAIQAALRQAF